jgi:tetratricopeptide (TPR) repeat protein
MGRAASEIISHEIGQRSGSDSQVWVIPVKALRANPLSQFRPVSAPGQSIEATAAVAEGATRLVMGQLSIVRDRLVLDVTERDPMTGKTAELFTVTAPTSGDLYTVADAVAHRLASKVAPFESRNNEAIGFWARGLEETDYGKASEEYAHAVQLDPDFASAWLSWAASASTHGDRAEAEKIVAGAQQHASQFSDLNRARLKLVAVELTGDRMAILAALNELARHLPDDIDNARAIADQNFAVRQFTAAAAAYRQLTRITPNDPLPWNQLGYTLMYAGDYSGAMSALQTYQKLSPNDANPLDSQGDVAFAFGRFAEAEKLYEQAASKNPSPDNTGDLYKAAESHLMTGDVAGADKRFEAYAAARRAANDPLLPVRMAQWRFVSGRRSEAIASLTSLVAGDAVPGRAPQLRALELTQLAVWNLQLGHRDQAVQQSSAALQTGAATPIAVIARFACENARTAAEWSAAGDRMLSAPQLKAVKSLALAYALYLSRDWQAAEPVWKQLIEHATADDAITLAIYGQILVELHREREAEPLVRLFPIFRPEGTQEFHSLVIPKIFDTRAAVLAAQGKPEESAASRKVFQTLWGPG